MPGSVPPLPTAVDDVASSPVSVSGPAHLLRVTVLMAGSCLPILGAVLIAPVLPKMQDHFESTPGAKALVPLALTIPALALALLAPFAGVVVDRLGRKRLLIVTTVLYSVPPGERVAVKIITGGLRARRPARDGRAASADLAGGAHALSDAARRCADAGEMRTAGHLAEFAVQAAPDDARVHAALADVNEARAEAESSLMAQGIFTWAAAESRQRCGGKP